jgi:hypothetical protein
MTLRWNILATKANQTWTIDSAPTLELANERLASWVLRGWEDYSFSVEAVEAQLSRECYCGATVTAGDDGRGLCECGQVFVEGRGTDDDDADGRVAPC